MKNPIENEHRDANYQTRRSKKQKTATQATCVSELCIVIKLKICWIKSLFRSIKLKEMARNFRIYQIKNLQICDRFESGNCGEITATKR